MKSNMLSILVILALGAVAVTKVESTPASSSLVSLLLGDQNLCGNRTHHIVDRNLCLFMSRDKNLHGILEDLNSQQEIDRLYTCVSECADKRCFGKERVELAPDHTLQTMSVIKTGPTAVASNDHENCYDTQMAPESECRVECFQPSAGGIVDSPMMQSWRPEGPRKAFEKNAIDFSIVPIADQSHTMHVDTINSDSIMSVVAPSFELDWVAEPDLYAPEGPTLDNAGNVYFTPLSPKEDIALIALDAETGARKWTVPGKGPAWGAPLILNDPTSCDGSDPLACEQLIYVATRETAFALKPNGTYVWEKPTGLPSIDVSMDFSQQHQWGFNYLQQADALIGVSIGGEVFALSRSSGSLLAEHYTLPCPVLDRGKWQEGATTILPKSIVTLGNRATDDAFGVYPDGVSFFESMINVIYGASPCVSNYFSVDSQTDRIYVGAKTVNGGTILLLQLTECDEQKQKCPYPYVFEEKAHGTYEGGTGSTPSISPDSKTVYVSDEDSHVLAFDAETLELLWIQDVGEQVAASIAVAAHNRELFVVTKNNILKLIEREDRSGAEVAWIANIMTVFPGYKSVNSLTPFVTANGIVVSIASVKEIELQVAGTDETTTSQFMLSVGYALLDRATGEVMHFAKGREESISASVVGKDGSLYSANSPVRRAVTRALFPDWTSPIVGGVSKFRVKDPHLVSRDAICSSLQIAENVLEYLTEDVVQNARSAQEDARQIHLLLQQANTSSDERVKMTIPMFSQQVKDIKMMLEPILGYEKGSGADGETINHALEAAFDPLISLCKQLDTDFGSGE